MNKQIDFSCLPNGVLIQRNDSVSNGDNFKNYVLMSDFWRDVEPDNYRLALNYWHFSDGSMCLPDGLVVEVKFRSCPESENVKAITFTDNERHEPMLRCLNYLGDITFYNFGDHPDDIIAVKVLGVTAEYGAQLGMVVKS